MKKGLTSNKGNVLFCGCPRARLLRSLLYLPLLLVVLWLVDSIRRTTVHVISPSGKTSTRRRRHEDGCVPLRGDPVPTFKKREDLGKILQSEEGLSVGVELGVQTGKFAYRMLSDWTNCEEYHLVDLWGHQKNYHDIANLAQEGQDRNYDQTMQTLKPWSDKTHVCRNYTSVCVHKFEDEYFDFIYVDARHDFKGVWEDLVAYWPKLRVGGIMAGHDYVAQDDVLYNQNWTINYDGTIDETGTVVKGAVDKFAKSVCRQVTVSYRESNWNTWAVRK